MRSNRGNRASVAAFAVIVCGCAVSEDPARLYAAALDEEACSGVREALAVGVLPPAAPAITAAPIGEAGTCYASTTAQLHAAVNDVACTDVVLRDGVYEPAGPVTTYLTFVHAKKLWAVTPGGVVLRFGINMRTYAGSELHGLVIDVDDPAHAVPIGPYPWLNAVAFWGAAADVAIRDCIIRGNGVLHRGIHAGQPDSFEAERVVIEDFLRYGLFIPALAPEASPAPVPRRPASVTDIVVRRVGDPAWRMLPVCAGPTPWDLSTCYAPGTQEHGIWIGFTTILERVRVRDVYWTGILTASYPYTVRDVVIRDADVDRIGDPLTGPGAAIGFEKTTHDLTLERFCVGPSVFEGVHAEWDRFKAPWAYSAQRLHVHHGVISAAVRGLYFDNRTRYSQIHDLHFRSASWAAVGLNQNWLDCDDEPEVCNTTEWWNLTFDVPDGACEITFSHPNLPLECYEP